MSEARNFLRFITFFGIAIAILVVVGLVLSSSCKAQTTPENYRKSIIIYAFKGLNTAEGLFVATPDYAKVCNNVDFSRNGFSIISKRWGFDTVKTVAGIDSIVGFGTYQVSNRQSCLVYAVDDSTKGYGAIWATRFGSDNPDSARKIKDYWSIQNPTRFSQYNDNLYATNGQQAGFMWDGVRAHTTPVNTPGLPEIIPLNTSGNLNGEYRYCLYQTTVWKSGTSYTWFAGTLSSAISVKNGQVLLRKFPRPPVDSIVTSVDSAYTYIGRTKANPGPLDDNDTIWLASTKIYLKIGASYTADTVTYTDNTADASFSNNITPLSYRLSLGRDSTRLINGRRFGSPTFVSSTTNATGAFVMWSGHFTPAAILGYAYALTLVDTITGFESDTSRRLFVGQPSADSTSSSTLDRVTIALPPATTADTGLVYNVYRATLMTFSRQFFLVCVAEKYSATTGWECTKYDTVYTGVRPERTLKGQYWPIYGIHTDSAVAADWFRVAQLPVTQLTLTDSVRCDSARMSPRFNLSTSPEIASQSFQWRSQFGNVAGSRIWLSKQFIDSQGNYGTNDFIDFNRNDGDFITGVKEKQFGLAVKKNRSSYVVPNGGGRPEKVSSFGCVAPLSYVSTDVGDLFVGDGGVYLETEGQALERVYNAGLVSEKLSNFVNMPDSVRRTIAGFWLPEKRQAIFSADYPNTSNDTAFVIDFRAGQIWSTWTNMVPKFGCLYSKNSTLGSPPPQTFYFTKAGGKTIYTYATNNKDANGNYPAITYQTVPLFVDWDKEQVDAIGLIHTDPSYGSLAIVDVVNEKDSAICAQKSFDSLGFRYVYKDMGAIPSVASAIRITTGTLGSTTFSNGIEAIEILYRKGVEKVMVK